MPSILANSVKQHHAALLRVSGVDAVYVRGNEPIEIRLVPGRSDVSGSATEGVAFLNTDSEWIARKEDLLLESGPLIPAKGDLIRIDTPSGVVEEYQVLRPDEGRGCWSPSDQFGVLIRIFTKYRGPVEDL